MADFERMGEALRTYVQTIRDVFHSPYSALGRMVAKRNGAWVGLPSVQTIGIVESDEELSLQQEQKESFGTVFDDWLRISRTASGSSTSDDPFSDEAVPSELEEWSYDASTDSVICTINSTSLLGFISNSRYNVYVLETRLSAEGGDDDWIGLVIAYAEDSEGNTHTLTVLRLGRGDAPMVVEKDHGITNGSDVDEVYTVASVREGLIWPDGTEATTSIGNGTHGGWDIGSPTLLKITREDDIVTIETSQFGDTDYFEPAKTVIDLSQDPKLAVFRGPQRYGYCCRSQPNATWDVLQRAGARQPIVDTRDYTWYDYVDGEWTAQASGLQALIDEEVLVPNQLHFNPTTGRYYFLDKTNELVRL